MHDIFNCNYQDYFMKYNYKNKFSLIKIKDENNHMEKRCKDIKMKIHSQASHLSQEFLDKK